MLHRLLRRHGQSAQRIEVAVFRIFPPRPDRVIALTGGPIVLLEERSDRCKETTRFENMLDPLHAAGVQRALDLVALRENAFPPRRRRRERP